MYDDGSIWFFQFFIIFEVDKLVFSDVGKCILVLIIDY